MKKYAVQQFEDDRKILDYSKSALELIADIDMRTLIDVCDKFNPINPEGDKSFFVGESAVRSGYRFLSSKEGEFLVRNFVITGRDKSTNVTKVIYDSLQEGPKEILDALGDIYKKDSEKRIMLK